MEHNCQLCGKPISQIGTLRKCRLGKTILRMCKVCRTNVLKQRNAYKDIAEK